MICFADTGMTKQRSWQNQNRSSSFLNCLQTIAYIILPFSSSNRLNQHIPVKWSRQASNLQPSACKADALPFELQPHSYDRLCLPVYPSKALSEIAGTGFEPVYMAYEAIVKPFQRNPQSPYRELNPDHLFGRQMCCPLHHTDEIELMGVEPMTFCAWNSCSPS